MKTELVDLQPQLEQSKIDNTKMMKVKFVFYHPSAPLWSRVCVKFKINTHTKIRLGAFQVIAVESVEVEAKSKVVRIDEEAATIQASEAQALKDECESDLAEAIPALEAAVSALDTLKVSVSQRFVTHRENSSDVTISFTFFSLSAFGHNHCKVNEKSSCWCETGDVSCVRDEGDKAGQDSRPSWDWKKSESVVS